jgi:membrane protease YdiL (CAAX protease family)
MMLTSMMQRQVRQVIEVTFFSRRADTIQAMAGILVHVIWQQLSGSTDLTVAEMVVTMAVFSVLVLAIFLLPRWAEVSPRWMATRQWLVLVWAVVAALGLIIPISWLQENMPELPNWIEDQQEMLLGDYWGYLVIGILAPLAEEVVFRGAILRTLLGWDNGIDKQLTANSRVYGAISVSAALFALIHMNPAQMPFAYLAGWLLGWMYWRTGSILPGMAYHWANNSAAYIIYHAYPDKDMKLIDLFKGSELHVYLAVFFSLLILLPALFQLSLRMKRDQ